jgi:hypothetical protein
MLKNPDLKKVGIFVATANKNAIAKQQWHLNI